MERKIYNRILDWKTESKGNTALMIEGARRVGKSYIVEEFAKKNYKSYILIDFNLVEQDVKDLFCYKLQNLDEFYSYLSTYFNVRLYQRESAIIFDEVQLFPRARSALKYLVADRRYDFIETGSLLSIKENTENILIPSEERHMKMYPLDFEEFLWAIGNTTLMPLIKDCYEKHKPLGQAMHRKAMEYFRQYMIVGGMPQSVLKYRENLDFHEADIVKRDILDLYRDDISKHAKRYQTKVRAIFDELPSRLQKHEKKFKISSLYKDAKFRDYQDAMFWLNDAMIVNNCYNTTEPNIGLRMNMERTSMKCYMADTGLLLSHAFDENDIVSQEVNKKILFGKLEFNEGMIVENIVSQMLVSSGHKLYFYSNSSREDSFSRMEIDFLISKKQITSRHNISPVEVKSGKYYTTSSLNKFRTKYKETISVPYIIHPNDYKEEDGVIYLPLYMTGLL